LAGVQNFAPSGEFDGAPVRQECRFCGGASLKLGGERTARKSYKAQIS